MRQAVHIRSSSGFFGAERVIVTLLKGLVADGSGPRLLVLEDHRTHNTELVEAARREGIDAHLVPCRGRLDRGALKALARLVEPGAIVHTHDVKSNLYGRLLARRLGCPLVATLHGWTSHSARMRLYEWLDGWVVAGFDALITVSEEGRKRLPAGTRGKVRCIPNGVDTDRFTAEGAGLGRGHWGIPEGPLVFGTIARFTPEKGHDLLLRAFAGVVSDHPRTEMLLLGDGPQRPRMSALAERLGVSARVHFAGSSRRVESALHDVDCYVSPSRTEGMPMAVLEAMATATPVIGTAVGEVPALLEGGAGVVVPPEDEAALRVAMERVCRGEVDLAKMGQIGRERAVRCYSAGLQARRYREVYAGLEAAGPAAAGLEAAG